ncbi:putative alpha/beta hydrolase fold protein [Mycobacterium xenopi 3993]|nr:putative alpha/beta hydrolase fold protein [Mycobacterium xenopi 3993]
MGPQVRMIFYDQRGHGRSGEASPETYTVTQLGRDLETVLQVVAPRAGRAGRPFDGGMTVLSHARQYSQYYGDRIVGAALISSAAEGFRDHCWGDPEKSGAGGGPVHRAVGAEAGASGQTCDAVADQADPGGGVLR